MIIYSPKSGYCKRIWHTVKRTTKRGEQRPVTVWSLFGAKSFISACRTSENDVQFKTGSKAVTLPTTTPRPRPVTDKQLTPVSPNKVTRFWTSFSHSPRPALNNYEIKYRRVTLMLGTSSKTVIFLQIKNKKFVKGVNSKNSCKQESKSELCIF